MRRMVRLTLPDGYHRRSLQFYPASAITYPASTEAKDAKDGIAGVYNE
jgi:hypothetical protein